MRAITIFIILLTGFSGYTQKVFIDVDLERKYGKFTERQKAIQRSTSLVAKGSGGTYIGIIHYKKRIKSIEAVAKRAAKEGADIFVYNGVDTFTYHKEKKRITDWRWENTRYDYKGNLTSYDNVVEFERYTKKKEKEYRRVYLFRKIPELEKKVRKESLYHMIDSTRYYNHIADRKILQYSLTKKRLQYFLDKGIDFNDIYKDRSFIELFVNSIAGGGYLPKDDTSLLRQKHLELLNLLIRNEVVLTKTSLLNSKRIVNTRIKEIEGRKEEYYNTRGRYRPKKSYIPYLKKVDSSLSTFIVK